MEKSELQRKVVELEQEVDLLRRYIAAMHESHQLGPIVIVPESFDPLVLSNVRVF